MGIGKTNMKILMPFVEETKLVLNRMFEVECMQMDPFIRSKSMRYQKPISAIVPINGVEVEGNLQVGFTKKLIFHLVQKMTGEERPKEINEDVIDLTQEILNQVYAGANGRLEKQGYDLERAVPRILTEAVEPINVDKPAIVFPFFTRLGEFHLEISIVPKSEKKTDSKSEVKSA